MSKLTTEARSAILSVRAKARKARNVSDANLPASIVKHLDAVITWADAQLKVAPVAAAKSKPAKAAKGSKSKPAKTAKAA